MSLFAKYGTGSGESSGNGEGGTTIIERPPYDTGNFTVDITVDDKGRPLEEKYEGDVNRVVKYTYKGEKMDTETITEDDNITTRKFSYDTNGYLSKIEVSSNEVM